MLREIELDKLTDKLGWLTFAAAMVTVLVFLFFYFRNTEKKEHDNKKPVSSIPKIVFPPRYVVPEKPCLSDVERYMKRVDEIFGKIGRGRENYFGVFNVKHDTAYMHALLKMPISGLDMWFIFYPNPDYNIFIMIFDARISRKIIDPIRDMIDKFYGMNGVDCDTTDGHPDIVWDEKGNYDIGITRNDMARATVMNPAFRGLWEQYM